MNKFLNELMTLATELNEAEGFNALTVINEMELLYNKHVAELKKIHIADDLIKLFSVGPTDECIEEWWSEGNDKKYPDWWERAPYRTNGDVIEEIKTAVKYFNKTNKS